MQEEQERLIKIDEVADLTGFSKSVIYKWVKDKRFPPPMKLSSRMSVWQISEINQYLKNPENYKSFR